MSRPSGAPSSIKGAAAANGTKDKKPGGSTPNPHKPRPQQLSISDFLAVSKPVVSTQQAPPKPPSADVAWPSLGASGQPPSSAVGLTELAVRERTVASSKGATTKSKKVLMSASTGATPAPSASAVQQKPKALPANSGPKKKRKGGAGSVANSLDSRASGGPAAAAAASTTDASLQGNGTEDTTPKAKKETKLRREIQQERLSRYVFHSVLEPIICKVVGAPLPSELDSLVRAESKKERKLRLAAEAARAAELAPTLTAEPASKGGKAKPKRSAKQHPHQQQHDPSSTVVPVAVESVPGNLKAAALSYISAASGSASRAPASASSAAVPIKSRFVLPSAAERASPLESSSNSHSVPEIRDVQHAPVFSSLHPTATASSTSNMTVPRPDGLRSCLRAALASADFVPFLPSEPQLAQVSTHTTKEVPLASRNARHEAQGRAASQRQQRERDQAPLPSPPSLAVTFARFVSAHHPLAPHWASLGGTSTMASQRRSYCRQMLRADLNAAVTDLLSSLLALQDRMRERDLAKARIKKRFVCGLREVAKHVRLGNIQCVIAVPNIEGDDGAHAASASIASASTSSPPPPSVSSLSPSSADVQSSASGDAPSAAAASPQSAPSLRRSYLQTDFLAPAPVRMPAPQIIAHGRARRTAVKPEVEVSPPPAGVEAAAAPVAAPLVDGDGALDSLLDSALQACTRASVPVIFALSRRKLAEILNIQKGKVSLVGVRDAGGAESQLKTVLRLGSAAREEFACLQLDPLLHASRARINPSGGDANRRNGGNDSEHVTAKAAADISSISASLSLPVYSDSE